MLTVRDYIESIRQSLNEIERGTDPMEKDIGDNLRESLLRIDEIAKQASQVFGLKEYETIDNFRRSVAM